MPRTQSEGQAEAQPLASSFQELPLSSRAQHQPRGVCCPHAVAISAPLVWSGARRAETSVGKATQPDPHRSRAVSGGGSVPRKQSAWQ